MKIEEQFNLQNILDEIKFTKKFVLKFFGKKLKLILDIIDYQIRLTGMYFKECDVKKFLGSVYEDNVVLNNCLFNQPYISLSIVLLIKNGCYGSARVILRQFFEYLMVAKFSEFDKSIINKWETKTEEKIEDKLTKNWQAFQDEIRLSRDITNKLESKRKRVKALLRTWYQLCDLTHPSKYAQQVLRVPSKEEEKIDWLKNTNFFGDTHWTLDLLFMLLCMNNHLLNSRLGKKAYRWYLGYPEDPLGVCKREKMLKGKIKTLIKEYFEINKVNKGINKILKSNIFEYKQNWS